MDVLKCNVSGKLFEITKHDALKCELFRNLLNDCNDNNEVIPIYRSPMLFEHVYAFLIDENYPYPRKYYRELDYYGVPYQKHKLHNRTKRQADILEGKIDAVCTKVDNSLSQIEIIDSKIEIIDSKSDKTIKRLRKIGPGMNKTSDGNSGICQRHNCADKLKINSYCPYHMDKCVYRYGYNGPYCNDNCSDDKSMCSSHK